ncbi:unnamed protein product [Peronospora effusa]|uniref:Uncharacterized protein n=1 Tax=Peronospora effusa TaxID=542832 RepID=A0A425BXG3_9STRA|nr:hypothetical protein DD237_008162 [Peronospora effusa]CAI5704033.1 unnamed protein product [Peronospora effusa]
MSKVGGWFKAKRVRGRAYLAEKNPVCTPSNRWWIYIMIAYAFAARAAVIFKQLNRHSVTVSMQREYLKSLMLFYIECVGAKEVKDVVKKSRLCLSMPLTILMRLWLSEISIIEARILGTSKLPPVVTQDLVLIRTSEYSAIEESEGVPSFGTLDPRRDRFN